MSKRSYFRYFNITTASNVERAIKTITIRKLSSGTAGVDEGSINGCPIGVAEGVVVGVAVGAVVACGVDIGCGVCSVTEQLYVEIKPALSMNCT